MRGTPHRRGSPREQCGASESEGEKKHPTGGSALISAAALVMQQIRSEEATGGEEEEAAKSVEADEPDGQGESDEFGDTEAAHIKKAPEFFALSEAGHSEDEGIVDGSPQDDEAGIEDEDEARKEDEDEDGEDVEDQDDDRMAFVPTAHFTSEDEGDEEQEEEEDDEAEDEEEEFEDDEIDEATAWRNAMQAASVRVDVFKALEKLAHSHAQGTERSQVESALLEAVAAVDRLSKARPG